VQNAQIHLCFECGTRNRVERGKEAAAKCGACGQKLYPSPERSKPEKTKPPGAVGKAQQRKSSGDKKRGWMAAAAVSVVVALGGFFLLESDFVDSDRKQAFGSDVAEIFTGTDMGDNRTNPQEMANLPTEEEFKAEMLRKYGSTETGTTSRLEPVDPWNMFRSETDQAVGTLRADSEDEDPWEALRRKYAPVEPGGSGSGRPVGSDAASARSSGKPEAPTQEEVIARVRARRAEQAAGNLRVQPDTPDEEPATPLVEQPFRHGLLWNRTGRSAIAPFEVRSRTGQLYMLKLVDAATGNDAVALLARGGQTLTLDVPVGNYRLKYCVGSTWYGEADRFGPGQSCTVADDVFEFRISGNYVEGNTVTLYTVSNGNLETRSLNPDDF